MTTTAELTEEILTHCKYVDSIHLELHFWKDEDRIRIEFGRDQVIGDNVDLEIIKEAFLDAVKWMINDRKVIEEYKELNAKALFKKRGF